MARRMRGANKPPTGIQPVHGRDMNVAGTRGTAR